MKTQQQITAILLCALLGSTLGHEFLRAKRFAPQPRSSRLESPFQERALAPTEEECTIVCEGGGNDNGLQIIFNQTTSLVGVVNVTAKVSLTLDITAGLVGVFDGQTGAFFIIDLNAQTVLYVEAGLTPLGWNSAKATFEIFFSTLTSLKVFLDLKIGQKFTFDNISKPVLTVFGKLVIQLFQSIEIRKQIEADYKSSLTLTVQLTLSITARLKGSLNGFFQLTPKGLLVLYGDLIWLSGVFEGLEVFFGYISGGIATIIKAKIQFDFALIFGAASGFELFINLLFIIITKIDISICATLLNSFDAWLEVIVKLGGGVSTGLTGVFKVIYYIQLYIQGKIKLDVFIQILIEVSAERSSGGKLEIDIFFQALSTLVVNSNASSSEGLKAFVLIVKQLQEGNLIVRNVNVSALLVIFTQGGYSTGLNLLVAVLFKLVVVIQFTVSISALLLILFQYLYSAAGITWIIRLGIKIDISSSTDISVQIQKKVSISSLTKLLTGGVDALIASIPFYGDIYSSLSLAVKTETKESFSLSVIVKSSTTISTSITSFVKGIVGLTPTTKQESTTAKSGGGIFGGGGILGGIGGIFGSGKNSSAGGSSSGGSSSSGGGYYSGGSSSGGSVSGGSSSGGKGSGSGGIGIFGGRSHSRKEEEEHHEFILSTIAPTAITGDTNVSETPIDFDFTFNDRMEDQSIEYVIPDEGNEVYSKEDIIPSSTIASKEKRTVASQRLHISAVAATTLAEISRGTLGVQKQYYKKTPVT
ncbi:hypothetical protein JTB14_022682 [Gonioctena quinquepunctata]|nr:hypothetical protein JTB14_022682 [Gonioctena quinquepunctata]